MTEVQAIQIIGGSIIVLGCVNMMLLAIVLRGMIMQLKMTETSLKTCVTMLKTMLDILGRAGTDGANDND